MIRKSEENLEDMVSVSVIIPVYNAETDINECLESVINQSLQNIEIICVDDGSTDSSVSHIEAICDERIILLKQKNSGSGIARNLGIRKAKGEFVIFMDPDDYYPNEYVLEDLYVTAKEKNVYICGGNVIYRNKNNEYMTCRNRFEESKYVNFVDFQDCGFHTRYLINRNVILKNNIFYPNYRRYQDPPFLLQLMICEKRFYALNKDVYVYRVSNGNIKEKYSLLNVRDMMLGFIEMLSISAKYDLRAVQNLYWHNLFFAQGIYIYYYIFKAEKEIVDLAEKIDNSMDLTILEKKAEEAHILNSNNYKYFEKNYWEQIELNKIIDENKQIIIYGAGDIGHKVLEYVTQKGANLIGIAVSKKLGEEQDFNIREITEYLEYRKTAIIVVSVSQKYKKEILRHLEELSFENVLYLPNIFPDLE